MSNSSSWLKRFLSRSDVSFFILLMQLIIIYTVFLFLSSIFQALLFGVSSRFLLSALTAILNAVGIHSHSYKYMLTSSYNTIFLTWGDIPFFPVFALLSMLLWLKGKWNIKLMYAIAGLSIIILCSLLYLFAAVFTTATATLSAVVYLLHIVFILAIVRHYGIRNLKLDA